MKNRISQAVIIVALAFLCGCTGLGRKVNSALPEFMRGDPGSDEKKRVQQLQTRLEAPTGASTPRTQAFERAKQVYNCRQWDTAASMFEDYIEDYPSSEFDEEAKFLLADSLYRAGDYQDSFSAFKDYAESYPVSNRAPCIEERVYTMGCAYLSGRRKTFLGIFTSRGVGEEMFIWLVQTYPNAARSADAQWQLGRYYVCDKDWPKATAAFDFLVKQYPQSEWFAASRYFAGYTRYRQVKGTVYDQAIVRAAKAQFESYLKDFPNGQWRADAERLICVLDNIAAQKLLNVAQWYVDQCRPWSARYYFERLQTLYPNTNAAACGSRIYARLPVTPPCPGEEADVARRVATEESGEAESRPDSGPASRP